jgi:hypothetical protein
MIRKLVVSFGEGREYALTVAEPEFAASSAGEARAWLGKQFEEAGCEPSNPMGKLLPADLLLGVAAAAGEAAFAEESLWRDRYAACALLLRESEMLEVNVAAYTVRARS